MPGDKPQTTVATAIVLAMMVALPAVAMEPNGGYYEGLATLYPYNPVFCDKNSGLGSPCFGMPGAGLFLPRSAPLPPGKKHCRWADSGEGWYQWQPRTITLYGQDSQVCYLEDRGKAQNINDLPKDDGK